MRRIALSLSRAFSLVLAFSLFPAANAADNPVPDGWFLWPMVEPADKSALDASALNAVPVGRVTVKDGVYVTADGHPIRFFGVNITSDDAFPSEAEAELLARRLAKAGINIARLHHLDNPWGVGTGGSIWPKKQGLHRELDRVQLDKLHRLIAILAKHGIYSNLNLKVSKSLVAADGFTTSVEQLPDFQKRVDFFDHHMIELQKDYARRLLTTKNPYTGYAPVDDPAVAIIEINNENSLLGYFTRDIGQGAERFTEPFRSDLAARWNTWLAQHYADTDALAAAWNNNAVSSPSILPVSSNWFSKLQPGSVAILEPGADSSSFNVTVEKTSGADWHVQISTCGLKLEDNVVYTVGFEVRGRAVGNISVGVSNDSLAHPDEPWRSLGLLRTVDIGTGWTPIRLVFPAHSVAGGTAMLSFNVSAAVNRYEIRGLHLIAGTVEGGLRPGQSLEARNIPLLGEPTTRQWADWIAFLASVDRAFAEEMRASLRNELHVQAPMVCSQINFTGTPALNREQSSDFADTHTYWQHPEFPGSGWDRAHWTIANSPQLAVFGSRRFGELGNIAFCRVAGKPFAVSEYDHPAPSEYVCEMYPELAIFACRQNWDALYAFDLGTSGSRNVDGRITGYFDQLNHPAKWSLAPFATRVFRAGLIGPATAVAELRPGKPVWAEASHFDMLWAKLNPDHSFDFLDCRLQVNDQPTASTTALVRSGNTDVAPARVIKAAQGNVLVASAEHVAIATGFIGGATIEAGALRVTCPRFGRDFATVAVIALDNQPLVTATRVLATVVARAENQDMKWNQLHNSVGMNWGCGPTIVECIPAKISLATDGPRQVFALKPDGTRAQTVKTTYASGLLSFTVSPEHKTLHYEIVPE